MKKNIMLKHTTKKDNMVQWITLGILKILHLALAIILTIIIIIKLELITNIDKPPYKYP